MSTPRKRGRSEIEAPNGGGNDNVVTLSSEDECDVEEIVLPDIETDDDRDQRIIRAAIEASLREEEEQARRRREGENGNRRQGGSMEIAVDDDVQAVVNHHNEVGPANEIAITFCPTASLIDREDRYNEIIQNRVLLVLDKSLTLSDVVPKMLSEWESELQEDDPIGIDDTQLQYFYAYNQSNDTVRSFALSERVGDLGIPLNEDGTVHVFYDVMMIDIARDMAEQVVPAGQRRRESQVVTIE